VPSTLEIDESTVEGLLKITGEAWSLDDQRQSLKLAAAGSLDRIADNRAPAAFPAPHRRGSAAAPARRLERGPPPLPPLASAPPPLPPPLSIPPAAAASYEHSAAAAPEPRRLGQRCPLRR